MQLQGPLISLPTYSGNPAEDAVKFQLIAALLPIHRSYLTLANVI